MVALGGTPPEVVPGNVDAALQDPSETVPEPPIAPAVPVAAGDRREVLLTDAVEDFKHIADNVAGHRSELVVCGGSEDVYPQPYCYLTTRLIQMHAAGLEDMDFDTVAVVSGASAMFGYQPGAFMPKYAFHHRGPDDLVAQATGHATESVRVEDAREAWNFVKESVDSGRPVSAWHGEMMLLAGYRDADAEAERQVFAMKDGNGYFAEWWTWDTFAEWLGDGQQLSRHSGRVAPRPKREVALRVMRDLVVLSAGVPENIQQAFPKATFGLAGIEAWAADCADVDEHTDWSMCHPENPQWTVRNSSALYLQRTADEGVLSAGATHHVRRAAELYRAAYGSWQEAYRLVGYPAPEGSGKVREKRLAAAAAVRRAAEHEQAAITELRQARAAEGVGVPVTPAEVGAPETKEGAVKTLKGLEWQQHTISQLACIEGCLKYLGSDISSAWLFGGTGHAFVINIPEGLDPSGPTAWDWSAIHDLGPNLGYTTERVFCRKDEAGDSYPERQKEAWDFVRAAIDRGVPCYGWELHPWIPDYYVITGYDDTGYYYSGCVSGGPLEWQRLGDIDVTVLQAFSVERCEPASDEKVLKDMLAHILPRVEKPDGWNMHPGYVSGQPAFEAWAKEVEEGQVIKDGHSYNAWCWQECRAMAVEFLQEAKTRLSGRCDEAFDEAIAHYTVVRDKLQGVVDLHPMRQEGWDNETKLTSPEAAALLREAGAAELEAIQALKRIAAAL